MLSIIGKSFIVSLLSAFAKFAVTAAQLPQRFFAAVFVYKPFEKTSFFRTEGGKSQMKTAEKRITQENFMQTLDIIYKKALDGIPYVSPPIEQFANDYLSKYTTKEKAAKAMIKNQIVKCTTSGFLTGFGGVITLPISIPANIGSVLYVQMRMIACAAYIAGFDLHSDQVQTFVYACLAGVSVLEVVKQAGIKFGVKLANGFIKKLPGKVLTKINQKVGFRFITKSGTKGIVNLGKMIPGIGAIVGGSLDLLETKAIGNRAYKWFFEGDFAGDVAPVSNKSVSSFDGAAENNDLAEE